MLVKNCGFENGARHMGTRILRKARCTRSDLFYPLTTKSLWIIHSTLINTTFFRKVSTMLTFQEQLSIYRELRIFPCFTSGYMPSSVSQPQQPPYCRHMLNTREPLGPLEFCLNVCCWVWSELQWGGTWVLSFCDRYSLLKIFSGYHPSRSVYNYI